METLQTLRPLTQEHKTALDPRTDSEVLAEARARFEAAQSWEAEERQQQYEAQRFAAGAHWPDWLKAERSQPGQQQPSLVVDRIYQFEAQILNAYRRNPLGIRVRPKSGGATQQVATILEGLCRDIEADSQAAIAYTTALSQAIATGEGFFRLTTAYEDPYSFRQCLKILPIYDRMSVFCDPASTHPAGLDMDFCFVVSPMTHSAFCAKYRVQPADVGQWAAYPQQDWVTRDLVRVADYYYKVWEMKTLVQMPNGTVLEQLPGVHMPPEWPTRESLVPTVYWVTLCGYAVLAKTRWLGRHIPVIRVEGRRTQVDGKARRTGIVQAASDSQLAYDAYRSAEMIAIALTPKAPFILYAETISGYEHLWNQANDAHLPYLPIKAVTSGGQLLPPPRREVVEPAVQAITQAALMAAQDIQATVGQYGDSVGQETNAQSGAAIDSRKREGEQTTAGFTANLAWSIEACGRQLVEILPKLYAGQTELRQVGKDGTVRMTKVNQAPVDDQGQPQEPNALAAGVYECVVTSGPSYDTSRELMNERLGILLGAVPQVAPYVLDLYVGSLDIPAAEQLSARLKSLVPPEALAQEEGGTPETQLAQAQNALKQAQHQVQMVTQQLQESKQTEQVSVQQVKLLEQQVATMQTRLADKQRDLAIDLQRTKWQHEEALQSHALKAQELQLKYALQATELAHDMQQPPASTGPLAEE